VRVRAAVLAGTLSVTLLAGIGASIAAAAGPSEAEPPPAVETERIRIIVAGATVSGIAAITGWLLLRGRRRAQQDTLHRMEGTPGDGTDFDVEQLLIVPDGVRHERHAGSVTSGGPAPLWEAEDDRPRWIRRFEDQNPARTPAKRPADRWVVDEVDEEVPR
jgi:hypothetical protein